MNIRSVVGLFTLSFLGMNLARGIDNPIVEGPARFTVITPERIRIEYAPGGKFVAARSLFAVERTARWDALHAPAGGWRESFRNPRTTTSACPIPPTSGILTVAVGWSRMQEKTSCRS